MDEIRQVRQLQLDQRQLLIIDDARDHVITCEYGELWITQDGDRRDVILPAGRSWRIERPAQVVLSAFTPSLATLAHTHPGKAVSRPRRDDGARLLTRIRRWRFPTLASFPARFIF
jgi:hypothetical protein